jgi:hypothetical protein
MESPPRPNGIATACHQAREPPKIIEFRQRARVYGLKPAQKLWVSVFSRLFFREKIMAVFSGPDIPSARTSWGHQALLWFVTND